MARLQSPSSVLSRLIRDRKIQTLDEALIFCMDIQSLTAQDASSAAYQVYIQEYYGEHSWQWLSVVRLVVFILIILISLSLL